MSQFTSPTPQTGSSAKLLLVALGLALLAVVLTNLYIEMVRRTVDEKSITVYVLRNSVSPGDRISDRHYEELKMPATFRKSFDAMGSIDEPGLKVVLTARESFKRSASQGELITYRLFENPTERAVDSHVASGMRAITLPVNARTTPGGLREGMYVDIEAPFVIGDVIVVEPVMERVRVFALGARTAFDDPDTGGRISSNYRTITVQVTPEEATQLSIIQRMAAGEFELHLRNPGDMGAPKIPEGGINRRVADLLDRLDRLPADDAGAVGAR